MNEVRRLNGIRDRLVDALKYEGSLPGLRAQLVEVIADIDAYREGRVPSSVAFRVQRDAAAGDTIPCPPPESAPESAPAVPVERPSGGP